MKAKAVLQKFLGLLLCGLLLCVVQGCGGQNQDKTLTNSIGMEMVLIPAGSFVMGSEAHDSQKPVHPVSISKPFYVGKYEVTQAQWEEVMGDNPSHFKGREHPVEMVSWEDVQGFIRRLNEKEGTTGYRLPTEAEWEYAARAGTSTAYFFGDDGEELFNYAWYKDNSENKTQVVGLKEPNAWGLYDVHGNVWEWVEDWYGEYQAEAVTDPTGPSDGSRRGLRGGSWYGNADNCRVAARDDGMPGNRRDTLGFRLAFSPE